MGGMNVIKRSVCGGMNTIPRGVAGLFLLAWGSLANAGNDVTVNTSIIQGACAVSVMNNGVPVSELLLGDIASSQLTNKTPMAGFTPVTLRLSACGLADAGQAPFVKLDESSFAQQTDVPYADDSMFRKAGAAGGTSLGYFIFVANTTEPVWAPVNDSGLGDGVYGKAKPIPMGGAGAAEGATKTVFLGVGCGAQCQSETTHGGSVLASLVFTFLYK